ncbi:MAG: protein kinase [Acidobacteriota bacterium]
MRVCSVCRRCYDDSVAVCGDEMHPPLSDLRDGSRDGIAGYRIESLVESSLGGEIYRAVRIDSGQSCLVRLLSADEKNTEQFLREAKLASSLFHPSIVDTYEVGSLASGEVFVVSEDADGRLLREFLDDRGTPELLTSIEIIRQAAEALHTLHQSGFTHSAVRPENIVLTTDKERGLFVRIQHIDFGGVISGSIISNKFLIDSALNSLRYFAPEQCTGSERSAQTDVYSLGTVFYELLAGAPPFDASKALGLIEKHKRERVPDIRIDNFELRMLVTHSLMEALQKQPRMRQSSADLLARQLRHIEQLATHATTPPPAGVIRKPIVPARPAPQRVVISPTSATADSVHAVAVSKPETETSTPHAGWISVQAPPIEMHDVPRAAQSVPGPSGDAAEAAISEPSPIVVAPRAYLSAWKKKFQTLAASLVAETKPVATSIFESAAAPNVDQPSVRSSSAKRRKIEWHTPDDDIPSEAAVLEVRANEGAPLVLEPVIAMKSDATETRIDEVRRSKAVEIPVVEKLPVESVIEAPTIVGAPTADDVSLIAKARHIAARRRSAKSRVVAERKQKAVHPPDVAPPEKAVTVPPSRVIAKEKAPAKTAVQINVSTRAPASLATVGAGTGSRDSTNAKPKRSGLGFKVNLSDLEEITLVRPPIKRIKIDWDRAVARPELFTAKPQRTTPREIVFSPTLLGETPRTETVEPLRNDDIFAGYGGSDARGLGRHRSVMIGGGIAALLALLLFGNDSITRYFQTWSSADSVSTESVSARDTRPPAGAATAKTSKQKGTIKDRAGAKERNVALPPLVPKATSRVDSRPPPRSSIPKKTKPASKIKMEKRAYEKPPHTSAGSATRPRIVVDPKH